MKTIILPFTLFYLSIFLLRGQDYVYAPFVEEGTRWSYAFVRQVSPIDYKAGYFGYQIKGDTIINGLNYKKLLDGCSEDYLAALREEDKRVYIIKKQEDERLFFDFNLQEGDYMKSGSNGSLYLVTKIDTIQIGETKRKRFVFDSVYETWIEGIGALEDFYPLQGRLLGSDDQGINYQKKGVEIIYKTDEWYFKENECDDFSSINGPKTEPIGLLFPNPVKDWLYMKTNPNEFLFAQIKDLAGRICLRSYENPINVFSLPEGIYILELKMKHNSETVYKKFIKQ